MTRIGKEKSLSLVRKDEKTVVSRSHVRPKPTYKSCWVEKNNQPLDKNELEQSLRLACDWLIDYSMCKTKQLPDVENPYGYCYDNWVGACREYYANEGQWQVFGPVWHTGQMVKALVQAHRVLGDKRLLSAAKVGAEFILSARIGDPADPDYGAINAQENGTSGSSATSCMLESLDGLIYLSEETGEERYWQAVLDCLKWARRRMFLPDEGLFLDDFDFHNRQSCSAPNTLLHKVPGRPLLDNGVFLKGYRQSGDEALKDVFYKVVERLLEEEFPAGNWIKFPPCDQVGEVMHPRQAYWWGYPMIMAWQESGDEKYLACAHRVAVWYQKAQQLDGGMFRMTDLDFRTPTYGHATSGILSAACHWGKLISIGQGGAYRDNYHQALKFAHSMQFTKVSDKNLSGAILEKVLPPDGSDRLPYHVRDLGTIFYVQALSTAILDDLL